MATKKQVEEAIRQLEGFRAELELFDPKRSLPEYDWRVMAPQRWKISEWKNARLAPYRTLAKGVTVYRGDDSVVPRDMQLGNLRDSYYEAVYGPIKVSEAETSNVIKIAGRRRKSSRK